MPGSLEDIPLTIITTLEQLQQLKAELMSVKEFAVDMEVIQKHKARKKKLLVSQARLHQFLAAGPFF